MSFRRPRRRRRRPAGAGRDSSEAWQRVRPLSSLARELWCGGRELRAAVDAAGGDLRPRGGAGRGGRLMDVRKVARVARWEFLSAVTRRTYIFAVVAMPVVY